MFEAREFLRKKLIGKKVSDDKRICQWLGIILSWALMMETQRPADDTSLSSQAELLQYVERHAFVSGNGIPGRSLKLGPWPKRDCQKSHDTFFPEFRLNSSVIIAYCVSSITCLCCLQPPPLKAGAVDSQWGKASTFSRLPYFGGIGWLSGERGPLLE